VVIDRISYIYFQGGVLKRRLPIIRWTCAFRSKNRGLWSGQSCKSLFKKK